MFTVEVSTFIILFAEFPSVIFVIVTLLKYMNELNVYRIWVCKLDITILVILILVSRFASITCCKYVYVVLP